MSLTIAERVTALETEVSSLRETVEGMDKKLDDLLALRNKGAGVFWFVSTILGGGVVLYSFLSGFLGYFKHG